MKPLVCNIVSLLLLITPLSVFSQSYDKMWKNVEKAQQQSLPQTAIGHLDKIISVARQDNNGVEILRALMSRLYFAQDISPDSAKAILPIVEKEASMQNNEADRCVWHMALGCLYINTETTTSEESRQNIISSFKKATDNAVIMAKTPSHNYLPLLSKGRDSNLYGDDMLSVVFPFVAQRLKTLHTNMADSLATDIMKRQIEWYQSNNNIEATLLSKLDSASLGGHPTVDFCQSMVKQYAHLPLSAEICLALDKTGNDSLTYDLAVATLKKFPDCHQAPALKNIISRLTQPRLYIYTNNQTIYPNQSTQVFVSHCNTTQVTLCYKKLPCSALDPSLEKMGDKDFKRLAKKMTFKKTFSLRNDAPNKHATDTIELKIPEAGIYLLKAQGADTKESYRLLYVSSLAIMQLPQPLKKVKICVTDSKNGQPLPHAEIVMRSHADNDNTYQTHLTTNDKGEAIVDSPKNYTEIFASWKDDNSMRPTSLTHSYKHYQYRQKDTRAKIFTDRAVYRPSQKVRVGGFVFNQTDDSTKAVPSATITLKLCNTNNRHIESSTVTTDSFGAFETSFTLPQECLNGNFHIYTDYGSANFKVEEYKRPRFKINLRQPKTAYHLGDTVTIEGQVTTWSGTPLGDTKVCCSVRRNTMIWLREDHYNTPLTLRDTLTTNPEGMFQLKVALAHSAPTSPKKTSYRRYCYAIEAKATDTNGETEQATLKLYVGNEKTLIDINMPETLCKEHPKQIFATQSNHMGATVGGKANVWITNQNDTILKTTIDFNRKGQFHFVSQLASGEYKIAIAAADDTTRQNVCEKTFTLFSLSDQHPVGSQPLTVWQRNSSFDTDSASIDVVVATPLKDTWLRYDLATNDKVVESKILHLSDSTLKFKYKYLDKYGDGIHAQFALLHDGRLYHRSVVLEKPIPDKSLEMKWLTFRDKTTPGAEETWTMQITKNGKPIDASLLATVYDASLNKIKKHTLPFHLNFNRSIQTHTWSSSAPVELNIVSFKPLKLLKYVPLSFTTPTESYFSSQSPTFAPTLRQANIKLKKRDTALTFASAKGSSEEQALAGEHELDAKTNAPVSNDDPSVDSLAMRTDFSETAFFSSSIKTDSCGVARIEFRLPQSITAWNFMALAHTQNLDYAFADTIVVVEKPLTIETNTPRFLRKGDKTVLAVTATNHDTTAITGKINLLLTDAATGKKLYSATKNLSLPQKSRDIVEFPITVTDETTLILCRTIGTTDRFDDGEQQYIPVISDHRKSITSIPFSIVGEKQREISLEKLYKQPLAEKSTLTLEYTANPAWSVLNALPSTVGHNPDCATTLAANYASLSITRAILRQFPQIGSSVREWLDNQAPPTSLQPLEHNQELKQTALQATPWQQEADQQRQRLAALAQDTLTLSLKQNSMLDKLKALQTAQGGWQWFPGMTTGTSLTIDITHSLLLTISNNPSISGDEECTRKTTLLINKAMTFLDNMATKQLETIKQNQATPLSPSLIKYLYLTTLIDRPTNKTIEKLIETLAKQSILTLDNLYYKSLAACVLNKHGKHNEAQKLMQSLMQHTTNDTLSGRFFDSSKAPGRYSSYRMETHLATLNALQQVWPDSTIYINEMKRWLTQSKHTQDWANPLLSVNAAQYLAKNIPTKTNPSHFGKIALYDFDGSEILSADTSALKLFSDMGYIKINTPSKKKHKIVVSPPKDNQLSYGAAYLTNYLPIEITQASSSGFELNIKMYKETTRGLQAITSNTRLSKSDRVTMRYEIKARRNYDFVSLTAPRAACMEPTDPLSGYRNGGYRAVGDTGTTWFFDHLSKGEHVVEEQFDIDRSGTFVVAPAQTQCLYAPEFGANSSAIKIIVID